MYYQTCYNVVLTSLLQSWYNKNAKRSITQDCNNIVISWLYQTCWNDLVTSLIISTRLLQVVNSLLHTSWQLAVTNSANTTCWRLVGRLARIKMWDFCVCKRKHTDTQQEYIIYCVICFCFFCFRCCLFLCETCADRDVYSWHKNTTDERDLGKLNFCETFQQLSGSSCSVSVSW